MLKYKLKAKALTTYKRTLKPQTVCGGGSIECELEWTGVPVSDDSSDFDRDVTKCKIDSRSSLGSVLLNH